MKRIIVSVTNDLTTDQRVSKVCNSLVKMGFDVLLVGRKLTNSKPINRPYKTKRISLLFNKGFFFYAEYNLRLFFYLLFVKKSILLSNDLDTLLPNYLVARLQHKKVVFDSHELFSEIPELQHRSFVKRCWKLLESFLLPKINLGYTVSNSIANFYKEKYRVSFHVIKNYPVLKEIRKSKFSFPTYNNKIILYQGALNIGRGIELMIDTMPLLENCLLVLIGDGDVKNELNEKVHKLQLQDKIKFLDKKVPNELHHLTPLADVGLSLEEDMGLNYRYALPNKLFDYTHAKIPCVVSNLVEMKHYVVQNSVGEILSERTPKQLAQILETVFKSDYNKALTTAKEKHRWQTEEAKLSLLFKQLM